MTDEEKILVEKLKASSAVLMPKEEKVTLDSIIELCTNGVTRSAGEKMFYEGQMKAYMNVLEKLLLMREGQ